MEIISLLYRNFNTLEYLWIIF